MPECERDQGIDLRVIKTDTGIIICRKTVALYRRYCHYSQP